jgi:hypothetical protein
MSEHTKIVVPSTEGLTPDEQKAFLDGSKLFHDTFKHLTTLSTGSILLLVTFFDRFKALQAKSLAIYALIGFMMCTLGSVFMMIFLSKDVQIMGKPTPHDWIFRYGSRITAIDYVLSV